MLLVATSGTVLLGTLYPLLIDALGQGKISVGPPYFNAVFVPLMLPLAALLGFAPLARWKGDEWRRLLLKFRMPLAVVVLASVGLALGTPGLVGHGRGYRVRAVDRRGGRAGAAGPPPAPARRRGPCGGRWVAASPA